MLGTAGDFDTVHGHWPGILQDIDLILKNYFITFEKRFCSHHSSAIIPHNCNEEHRDNT